MPLSGLFNQLSLECTEYYQGLFLFIKLKKNPWLRAKTPCLTLPFIYGISELDLLDEIL